MQFLRVISHYPAYFGENSHFNCLYFILFDNDVHSVNVCKHLSVRLM